MVNDLLKSGAEVHRLLTGIPGKPEIAQGSFFVAANNRTKELLDKASKDFGVQVTAVSQKPSETKKINALRIALWDTYGGSMPSGWTRLIMEQYHFPFTVIYPQEINSGIIYGKSEKNCAIP